jgi:cell fate regulator YaaT (PSP1 superfamily)
MKVVKVQFHPADKEYFFLSEFIQGNSKTLEVGDQVVVETDVGQDLGCVTYFDERPKNTEDDALEVKPMLRHASQEDLDVLSQAQKNYPKYLKDCQQLCDQHNLEMKLVAVYQSLDGARLTFYFTSNKRVDFRNLVKDLIQKYHKKIRLQQIGVRDEAKITGDYGACGLPLCCKSWLKDLGNVNSDYIKDQDLMHRGNERLSGVCGRLKCCLRYEEEAYKYSLDKLPQIGDEIKTRAGVGKVKAVHPLKQTVDLKIDGAIVEYPYLEGKLCQKEKCSGCSGCK